MGHNTITSLGKRLSYLLRHDRDYNFPESGFREVSDLIKEHGFTKAILEELVISDNKGRYEFNSDHSKIRAVQGHSLPNINPGLTSSIPPDVLYHGTTTRFLSSIFKNGIEKRTRNHVHLSSDKDTAIKVGSRHGDPIVLKINSAKMVEDGIEFYISKNNVWLVDFVDSKYIEIC